MWPLTTSWPSVKSWPPSLKQTGAVGLVWPDGIKDEAPPLQAAPQFVETPIASFGRRKGRRPQHTKIPPKRDLSRGMVEEGVALSTACRKIQTLRLDMPCFRKRACPGNPEPALPPFSASTGYKGFVCPAKPATRRKRGTPGFPCPPDRTCPKPTYPPLWWTADGFQVNGGAACRLWATGFLCPGKTSSQGVYP